MSGSLCYWIDLISTEKKLRDIGLDVLASANAMVIADLCMALIAIDAIYEVRS